MAEIDRDVIANIAPKYHTHGKSRVLKADIRARPLEPEPHDPELRPARRHARELEAQDDAMMRQRANIGAPGQAVQQKAGIKVVRFDQLARMPPPPMTERVYDQA